MPDHYLPLALDWFPVVSLANVSIWHPQHKDPLLTETISVKIKTNSVALKSHEERFRKQNGTLEAQGSKIAVLEGRLKSYDAGIQHR